MRIVFCGTPEFAVPTLRHLLADSTFHVQAVVTQPDRPRGRGQQVSAAPVKQVAVEANVPVFQPAKIRDKSAHEFLVNAAPDAVVIIAYGQIIPAELIALPRLGWINLHASLLPKYRGAAPIAWAIANGESTTGLTTMHIDAQMDTGPILLQQEIAIGSDETAPDLARRMAEAGAPLVINSLIKLERGEISPRTQSTADATYAPRLTKEHGRIDWSRPAQEVYNRMRGFAPWPGAYTTFRGKICHMWGHPAQLNISASPEQSVGSSSDAVPGTLIVVSDSAYVTCGNGTRLSVTSLQLEGRKRITVREFSNGMRPASGERLGA